MARPQSSLSKFVLSLPHSLSAKEVVAKAKARGMKTTESNVYRVRRLSAKKAGSRAPAKARGRAAAPVARVSGGGSSAHAEEMLRAVAAEVGLNRAVEVLQMERSRVAALIRR